MSHIHYVRAFFLESFLLNYRISFRYFQIYLYSYYLIFLFLSPFWLDLHISVPIRAPRSGPPLCWTFVVWYSIKEDADHLWIYTVRFSDVDPDPVGSTFISVCGSGSRGIKWRKNKKLTIVFFYFRRNRSMRNALPIIQEIKFIIFKSEPKKEDIIADILLRANL